MQDAAEHGSGALWLNVTNLAEYLGVEKSTVSERVTALCADGLIETKPGKGREKLIPVAEYLRLTRQTGDAAREAAAATRASNAAEDDAPDAPASPGFRDAQTREKQIKADLAELDLRERLGELVEVATFIPACQEAAELCAAALDALVQNAEDMAASVSREGIAGARAQYKRDARATRTAIAEAFRKILNTSPVTAHAPIVIDPSPILWGDLDPADR